MCVYVLTSRFTPFSSSVSRWILVPFPSTPLWNKALSSALKKTPFWPSAWNTTRSSNPSLVLSRVSKLWHGQNLHPEILYCGSWSVTTDIAWNYFTLEEKKKIAIKWQNVFQTHPIEIVNRDFIFSVCTRTTHWRGNAHLHIWMHTLCEAHTH